jgi:hypothetical protein
MTDEDDARIYVAIAAEADADDLVADIVLEGEHVASVERAGDRWELVIYMAKDAHEARLPLADTLAALDEVTERLGLARRSPGDDRPRRGSRS